MLKTNNDAYRAPHGFSRMIRVRNALAALEDVLDLYALWTLEREDALKQTEEAQTAEDKARALERVKVLSDKLSVPDYVKQPLTAAETATGQDGLVDAFADVLSTDSAAYDRGRLFLNRFFEGFGLYFDCDLRQGRRVVSGSIDRIFEIPGTNGKIRAVSIYENGVKNSRSISFVFHDSEGKTLETILDDFTLPAHGMVSHVNGEILGPYVFDDENNRNRATLAIEATKGTNFDTAEEFGFRNALDFEGTGDHVEERLALAFKDAGQVDAAGLYELTHNSPNPGSALVSLLLLNLYYRFGKTCGQEPYHPTVWRKVISTMIRLTGEHEAHHFREAVAGLRGDLGRTVDSEYSAYCAELAFGKPRFWPLLELVGIFYAENSGEPIGVRERMLGSENSQAIQRLVTDIRSEAASLYPSVVKGANEDITRLSLMNLTERQIGVVAKRLLKQHYGRPYEEVFGRHQPIRLVR